MKTIHDINFYKRGAQYGDERGMYMPGRYWVSEAEIVLAWDMCEARLADIDWTKKVCAETIFTTDIWHTLPIGTRNNLGRCIKYFSVHNMQPIKVANPGTKGTLFYKQKV